MKVRVIKDLPPKFDDLVAEAVEDGHLFLQKMKDEWDAGKNRFNQEREILFSVTDDNDDLIGIGGLNVDPYVEDPSVGRVRHVYIAKAHRSFGVGKILLREIIDHARDNFKTLRLRTHNPNAVKFYVSLGFAVDANTDVSHAYLQMTV
jgi:GNAT superfamily N-acetyltransferase